MLAGLQLIFSGDAQGREKERKEAPARQASKPVSLSMSEEDRLRLLAEQTPSDPYAMAAYGRYLKHKKGDALNGNRWEQRALELLASRRASVKELFP